MRIKTAGLKLITIFIVMFMMLMPCLVIYGMTFPDLDQNNFAYNAVKTLVDNEIINGYDDGNFYPNNPLKRSEYCKLISVAMGLNTQNVNSGEMPFSDIPQQHWSKNYIYACYNAGLIDGMGDGTFAPENTLTYEQAVKILVCAVGLSGEVNTNAGGKWYLGYVQTAKNHGLLDETIVVLEKSVSRATTAQLIYNAFFVYQPQKDNVNAGNKPANTAGSVLQDILASMEANNVPQTPAENVNMPVAVVDSANLIFVDAGHNYSGYDKGANGNGLKEEEITWKIADKLRIALERNGFTVMMSRKEMTSNVANTSVHDSLYTRCDMANSAGAKLFISIHCNSGGGTGIETYCYSTESQGYALASKVQNCIIANTGMADRKVKTANFVVIRETSMPAILVETGFLDKAADAAILASESGQTLIAEGIAMGVCEYKNKAYIK